MKHLLLLLFASILALSGCSKLIDGKAGDYTFTGTLFKDCSCTPIANAKIVYTTFRGTGFSPLTRSFSSQTDANGKFAIKENSDGLQSITIELANPPKYEAGPEIGRMDTRQVQSDVVHDFGELFATSRGQAGDSKYFINANLKISTYYQQKDSLVIGLFRNMPLILSPVPATYSGQIEGWGNSESFAKSNSISTGKLVWATSLEDYRKSTGATILPKDVYRGDATFTICNNGPLTDFVVDTFSHL